ncbi:type VI secretion system contractile sheath large subunit [Maioricimonas sp. JC845]|uniref:type VI secretion system contractile sheath large subunit n=1 Tax=Maioricimonas sp. JC845 TaxID=3232138 RepID=UPI0034592162
MSSESQAQAAESAEAEQQSASILDMAISHTRQTEPDRAKELLRALIEQAQEGTVTFDKNVGHTIERAIAAIDNAISTQVKEIMHHPKFQKLEGSWRGLRHLVMNSETGETLKIRVLNADKRTLYKDLDKAAEFDQSNFFKKLYENEFGTPGGEPYGALIGDYEFTNHPEDIDMLTKVSSVAAAAFCPFISAVNPGMFGMDSFTEIDKPRDLAKIFETVDYAKWKSFRESEDSRFVSLVMPRVMARLPYGSATVPVEEFQFEEAPIGADGSLEEIPHDEFCWMNAAYQMGTNLTRAFSTTGFCVAIRGAENGGKVSDLPVYNYKTPEGDTVMKCPTETAITDRREAELSGQGFLPLCHYKETDSAVFFGAQTTQKPVKYDNPSASANAEISARLPYIMAMSRFTHFLKVIGRDKIGSFAETRDVASMLNQWISQYVIGNPSPTADQKAKYPLAEARVNVREVPGRPGVYNAIVHMRPWLQFEELTTSMRVVARIPSYAQ